MNFRLKPLAVAAALSFLAMGAHANLVQNGGFEDIGSATLQPWGGYTYGAGFASVLPGWNVNFGNVDIVPASFSFLQSAASGSNFLDLNGFTSGGISQTLATVAGQQYNLNFKYSGNGAAAALMLLNPVGPTPLTGQTFLSAAGGNPVAWLDGAFTFTALSNTTLLSFNSLNTGTGGLLLDSVSVTAVPEPGTYALMLAGLGVVGWLARRRGVAGGRHAEPMAA